MEFVLQGGATASGNGAQQVVKASTTKCFDVYLSESLECNCYLTNPNSYWNEYNLITASY